ncbi:MAG TPA: isocitrate lyase/phosphoenolpyruvate mutase family protein [Chryseolinea sp.]
MDSSQKIKAERFKQLHCASDILVLPNIWDPLGALLLESLAYPAVATASASIAWTNGYDDGECIPFHEVLTRLTKIAASTKLPVTADIESGYADSLIEFQKNIEQVIITGVVGINLEDFDRRSSSVYALDVQCQRISAAREAADAMNFPLFINARTDIYLNGCNVRGPKEKLDEAIRRGKAYMHAGADGFFVPGMIDGDELSLLRDVVRCPINVMVRPGIPDLKTLKEIGVARVSLGPGFLKAAIQAMKDLAVKLKTADGFEALLANEVSSEYLKQLVARNSSRQ